MKREGTSNLPFPAWTGMVLTLLLILIDQVTKFLALSQLKGNPDIILIPGVLQLKYLENRGMAFGMLQGKIPLLIALCLLFFCVFLYIYIKIPKTRYYLPLICTALVLAAGAVGNLIDRVFRGYVIDFIYFSLIDFPVFNVADIYVTVATFLLAVLLLFYYKEEDFERIFHSRKRGRRED